MAEYLIECPKCNKYDVVVVKEHNPDTTDMSMRATLRCQHEGCGHEWEGWVTSPHYNRMRESGKLR